MNESEQRRKRLLEETKNLYNDRRTPPAIHPRYQSCYNKLYGSDSDSEPKSTFAIRGMICILLFCLFVSADYKKQTIGKIDSKALTKGIEHQVDLKKMWNNYIKPQ